MSFAPVIGQDSAVALLRSLLSRERLPHALLFVGPEGVGRHMTAVALAKALLCRPEADAAAAGPSLFGDAPKAPAREGPDGCGRCAACRRVADGMHPDLHLLGATGAKEQIQVEPTRELISALHLHSVEGGAKVAIVDPADRMNRETANTLLKTLEEPPRNTTLILVARERSLLLPTIVSRCQVVRFGLLDRDSLHRYFATLGDQSAFSASPETARIAVALSGGSIGRALAMAEGELTAGREALRRLLKGLERSDNEARLKWASQVADLFKDDAGSFEIAFEGMTIFLRDLAARLAGRAEADLASQDLITELRRWSERVAPVDVPERLDAVLKFRRALEANAHKEMAALELARRMAV